MNIDVIKSYLVQLGYEIDRPQLNKFNDALRATTANITRFTSGMATAFVEAGVAVTTALTAVATGTVALMESTARADLGFSLLARQMYMTKDAARSMKIATDALGYSIEDIVWGPAELRDRYRTLIEDQKRLAAGLGGADFETQMKQIRDITFEFTRLKVEAQYFVMGLTKALSKALTGDENGLLKKLREWNEWLITNIPALADKFAIYLVPVLRDVKAIWSDVADILGIVTTDFIRFIGVISDDKELAKSSLSLDSFGKALDHVSSGIRKVFDALDAVVNFVQQNSGILVALGIIRGAWSGAAFGAAAGPWGALGGGIVGGAAGGYATYKLTEGMRTPSTSARSMSAVDVRAAIVAAAQANSVDPALALAVADRESGMNPNALHHPNDGYGMMQVLPKTFAAYGSGDINNFSDNLDASMRYLRQLGKQYGGDPYLVAQHYNGSGPAARAYGADVVSRAEKGYEAGNRYYSITVQVATNASAHEIGSEVARQIDNHEKKTAQRQIVQASSLGQYNY